MTYTFTTEQKPPTGRVVTMTAVVKPTPISEQTKGMPRKMKKEFKKAMKRFNSERL